MEATELKLDGSTSLHALLPQHCEIIMVSDDYETLFHEFLATLRGWKAFGDGKGTLTVYADGVRLEAKLVNAKRENARTRVPKHVSDLSYSPTKAVYGPVAVAAMRPIEEAALKARLRRAVHGRAIDCIPLMREACRLEGVKFVVFLTETDAQIPYDVKKQVGSLISLPCSHRLPTAFDLASVFSTCRCSGLSVPPTLLRASTTPTTLFLKGVLAVTCCCAREEGFRG